jgi:hypothetical protein
MLQIKDVKFEENSWCEHCGQLEPYTAVVEDGSQYCLDCMRMNDNFELSEEERYEVEVKETSEQIKYHKRSYDNLIQYAIELGKRKPSNKAN